MALTIIKKGVGSAVHQYQATKKVFDPYSRKHFENTYKGMDTVLNGGKLPSMMGGGGYNPIDKGVIQDVPQYRKDMLMNKRHHIKGHAITLTPTVKNLLWKKALTLKERITVGMIPQDEMHPVKNTVKEVKGVMKPCVVADYSAMQRSRVVERNKAWYKRNEPNLKEFKRIMRVLEPDDPNITSITETWRPKTRRKA